MVAGGDITITIIPDIIPVEDTGVGDIGPVSYTHLDVYKRQVVMFSIISGTSLAPTRFSMVCNTLNE